MHPYRHQGSTLHLPPAWASARHKGEHKRRSHAWGVTVSNPRNTPRGGTSTLDGSRRARQSRPGSTRFRRGISRSLGRRSASKGSVSALAGLFSGKALDASVANLLWGVVCRCLTESKAKLPKNWPTRYCKMDEGYSSALAFGLTGIDDAEDGLPRSLCTDRYGVIQFAWIRG